MENCITGSITTIAVSATFIFSIYKWWEHKRERSSTLAGKIYSLLKEIGEGLDIIKNGPTDPPKFLPEKKWKEDPITNKDIFIISAASKSKKIKQMDFPLKILKNVAKIIMKI